MLLQIRRIIWKDLKLEARNLPELGSAVVFSVAASSLIGFAVSRLPSEDPLTLMGTGLTLVALFLAVFTSVMGVVKEDDLGTLDGVRMSPVEPVTFFISKLILNIATLEALLSISTLTAIFLSGWAISDPSFLIVLMLSSGIYLAAISALSSAIAVFLQARGVLMPTMILVLSLPVVQETLTFLSMRDYLDVAMLALSGLAFSLISSWLASYVLEV